MIAAEKGLVDASAKSLEDAAKGALSTLPYLPCRRAHRAQRCIIDTLCVALDNVCLSQC